MDSHAFISTALGVVLRNVEPPADLARVSKGLFQSMVHDRDGQLRLEEPYTNERFALIHNLLQHGPLCLHWTSDPTSEEVTLVTENLGGCISSLCTDSLAVLQQLHQFPALRLLSVISSDDDAVLAVLAHSLSQLPAEQREQLQNVQLEEGCNTLDPQLAQQLAQSLGPKLQELSTDSVAVLQQLSSFTELRRLSVTSTGNAVLRALADSLSQLPAAQMKQLQVVELEESAGEESWRRALDGCNTLDSKLAQQLAQSPLHTKLQTLSTSSVAVLQHLGQYTALRELSVTCNNDAQLAVLAQHVPQLPANQKEQLQINLKLQRWQTVNEQLAEETAIALGYHLRSLHTKSAEMLHQLHRMPRLHQLSIPEANASLLAKLAGHPSLGQLHVCILGQYNSSAKHWLQSAKTLNSLRQCGQVTLMPMAGDFYANDNEFILYTKDGPNPKEGGADEHELLMYLASHMSPTVSKLVVKGELWAPHLPAVVYDTSDDFDEDHYKLPLPAPVEDLELQIWDGGERMADWHLAIKATLPLVQDRLEIHTGRVTWDGSDNEQRFMFSLGRDVGATAPNLTVVINHYEM